MANITPELLDKYYNQTCSPEERAAVDAWLNGEAGKSAQEDQLLAEAWQKIKAQTGQKSPRPLLQRPLFRQVIGIAASILLLMGVVLTYRAFNTTGVDAQAISEATLQSVSTTRAQKQRVTLPDGTIVTLNSESEIQFPADFSDGPRIVHLRGEAFFEVVHNPDKPFLVYTEQTQTRVLGTSFDIRSYPETDKTELVVASGKVEFSQRDKVQNKVQLSADDKATLVTGEAITVSEVFAEDLISWKDGMLVFENTELRDIVKVLERWYDIEIMVKDSARLSQTYTFSYENPPLPDLIERMHFVAKFTYTLEGNQLIIN
ncbi:MAG: FecR domain-containing protein [Bacteroidota bacterium]